jgi:hypothetical protein
VGEIQLRLIVLRALNDRIDDVCLPLLRHLLAHKLPDFLLALAGNAAGDDRRAPRRQLVEHAGRDRRRA